jgi:signal transduction histidine kinase
VVSESTLARGRPFVLRYYEGRREVLTSTPHDADPVRLFEQLASAALPEFAHWVAVVEPSTGTVFSTCTHAHAHSLERCRDDFARGLDLDDAIHAVIDTGDALTWNDDGAGPRGVISRLVVEGRPDAVVIVAREPEAPAWVDDDLVALHDVVTALGVDLERLRLRLESRRALRASQRIASRLHQLISASLAVGSLRDRGEIVQGLARAARSVFDADQAMVSAGPAGSDTAVLGLVQRGRAPRLILRDDVRATELPSPRDAVEPWRDGPWLCAPVLDAERHVRGVVAVRRDGSTPYADEDRELAMLLGQLAATSLGALELTQTIQDNETRLRILVDAAPVGIVESDVDGRVRWWNRSASRLLRWPDYAPDVVSEVRWPPSVSENLSALWRDLLTGGLRDTDEFTATVGGRERRLAASAAVLPGRETPHVLTLLDDVTDQRELREEVRHAHRMELRGQVASTVAHDFNNLITLILGYADLLSRNVSGDPTAEELVRDIQRTSSRASALTTQLQSIGRTSEPAPVSLDIGAALSSNAEVLERIMGANIDVTWDLADSTPPVTIDADLLEQMILNLAMNARDAMPEGGTLRISTAVAQVDTGDQVGVNLGAGPYVTLAISDTGTGMDDETRSRCFEPLFTTKGPFRGTGLGLASARRLVEESHGVITCDSRLGVGTTFTIWLPAPRDEDPALPVLAEPMVTRAPRARVSATILLCEDDTGLRRLARQVLQRNGFVVHEADSAEEALDVSRLSGEPIDLLVSDVVLPAMSGAELARQLQVEQPDLMVLLMSGTASAEVLDGLDADRAAFLAKPFTPSALVDHVIDLLVRRPR